MIRMLRYMLTRLFLLCVGLRVSKYKREVERLWALPEKERNLELERLLHKNSPINSAGEKVTSLENLFCSPSLSKQALMQQKVLGARKSGGFRRNTAGTTGEPTHISLGRSELGRMLAVRDYCFSHYGVRLGQREARLWGRPESGIKSTLKNFMLNRRVFHPVGPGGLDEVLEMQKWQPKYVYGYASILLEAAKLIDNFSPNFNPPKLVVCTAETVLPAQKAFISRAFGAPVAEEYGSTEFDVLAFECCRGHRHFVNPWLLIEEGKGNCWVSDVARRSQYLIRYQQGDALSISNSSCRNLGGKSVIQQLQGRTQDRFFYISEEQKIHASTFSKLLNKYFTESDDVFAFSLQQNFFSSVDVFIDRIPSMGLEEFRKYFERELFLLSGIKIEVSLTVVKSIETSVKRNYFVQNLKA